MLISVTREMGRFPNDVCVFMRFTIPGTYIVLLRLRVGFGESRMLSLGVSYRNLGVDEEIICDPVWRFGHIYIVNFSICGSPNS